MNKSGSVIIRIVASCLVAGGLVFGISTLAGEDLTKTQDAIQQADALLGQINAEVNGGIDKRIQQLGAIPEQEPAKKQYCISLAKEIQDVAHLAERQRILFDTLNTGSFEDELQRVLRLTGALDADGLKAELQKLKGELASAASMVEHKRNRLSRQRIIYLGLFLVIWVAGFFYFGRGSKTRRLT
jgi:hypothetical protein